MPTFNPYNAVSPWPPMWDKAAPATPVAVDPCLCVIWRCGEPRETGGLECRSHRGAIRAPMADNPVAAAKRARYQEQSKDPAWLAAQAARKRAQRARRRERDGH